MSIKDLVPKWHGGRAPERQAPEGGLVSLQRDMNRLFDEFFRGSGIGKFWDREEHALAAFSPRVNVAETDREVRVSAELPGLDEKDVSLELDDQTLTLRGERKEEREEKGRQWHRVEHSYGSFQRVIALPARVDAGKATAKFRKGVLDVVLPKVEPKKSKARTIDIKAE